MFKRILVPLDGSGRAEQALPVAARLAQASNGAITLVRVLDTAPATLPSAPTRPNLIQTISETDRVMAESYLAAVASSAILKNSYVKTEVIAGLVAPTILSVAQSHLADIIVLCSHGFTGMTRWMLGSVAEKVARYAEVPVLILREGESALLSSAQEQDVRILVPLDGSASAEVAIGPATLLSTALSPGRKATLHFAHVVKTTNKMLPGEGTRQSSDGTHTDLHMAKVYLDATVYRARDAAMTLNPERSDNLTCTTAVVKDNDIANAIVKIAEQEENAEDGGMVIHADVIAMSTHGYGGLQHWAMGSITGRVLHTTRLPLLVVRPTLLGMNS